MRIRTRLLILILAILLPAFVAAALAVGYVYVEGRQAQENSIRETTRAFALLVANELGKHEGTLRALATSPSLAQGRLEEFLNHAQRLAPSPQTSVALLDADGRSLLDTGAAAGSVPKGQPLPGLDAAPAGAGPVLVSDLLTAADGGHQRFAMRLPVEAGGTTRYILEMRIDAAAMQQPMGGPRFPFAWLVSIVDRGGRVVARSRDAERYRGQSVSKLAMSNFAARDEGVFGSRNLAGVPVQAFYSTVPSAGWKVIVSIPTAEIRRVPRHAALFLAAIMAALLALAILLARHFGRRAIAPIEDLGQSAEELGRGRELVYQPQRIVEIDAVARRMAEASRQIRASQDELERRVREAVGASERAQAALLRSQKMEALGRLTGGIAHEFNNLLQTLTTALQMAALTSTQPRVQKLIETCQRTVSRASALTSQLGSFGRVQDARLLTVAPCEQLRNSAQLIRNVLRQGIALELHCEEDLWPVTVDPLQFDLALLNLAINARDAMPAGGRLCITARNCRRAPSAECDGGDEVLVSVTDTGTGMAPEVLARALDPFFTTKEPGQGSGLGLAQVYAFASQAQGSLVLSSTPGQGTRVEIRLPRSTLPLSPQPGPGAPREVGAAGGRVLFVEDDELVREAVAQGLEEAGFEVMVAASGERALAMIEAGLDVDLAFSDVVMPGSVSGIDLAGILRERRPGLPVVLATGYTDQRATIPGVQVLAKPYEIGQLVELLSSLRR